MRRAVRHPQGEHGVGGHGFRWRKPARGRRSSRPGLGGRRRADAAGASAAGTETVRPPQRSLTSSLHSFPHDRAHGDPHAGVHLHRPGTSRSSAPATSVCRWRARSRRLGARCCSSTSSRRWCFHALNRGESHIEDVPSDLLAPLVADGRLAATSDYDALRGADAILIALPTPLSKQREPDLSIVLAATKAIKRTLRRGSSSCWSRPPILEPRTRSYVRSSSRPDSSQARTSSSRSRRSERISGAQFSTTTIPKVVGGSSALLAPRGGALRARRLSGGTVSSRGRGAGRSCSRTFFVLSTSRSSMSSKMVYERMGIDVWEVLDAASTKPFGFMSFNPGPWPGWSLHSDRSVLSHVESARGRRRRQVHRARRRGQPRDAVLLPLADLAGAQPQEAEVDERLADSRARRRVQARHRRHARVAGAQADRAPAERRREASRTTTRTSRPCPSSDSTRCRSTLVSTTA